jgi:short subunit fatty acids transporter
MTAVVLSIGRILAETAPLYLTSGLASSNSISLINSGQTLTTRIYAQIYTADIHVGESIMYECAFVTMILVLLIILVVHVAIPAYYNYKRRKMIEFSRKKLQEHEVSEKTLFSSTKALVVNNIASSKKYQNFKKQKSTNFVKRKGGAPPTLK